MVKFEFALTENGEVFDIKNISEKYRQCEFTCSNKSCNGIMGFSIGKSMNKDGSRRKDFFFHKSKYDHGGESITHYNAKNAIVMKLNKLLSSNEPYLITLRCDFAGLIYKNINMDSHTIGFKQISLRNENILENISYIESEQPVGIYRPDIVLYNGNNVIRVIEIEYKHPTEQEKLEWLKEFGIDVLKVFIQDDSDVDKIREDTFDNYQYFGKSCNPILTTKKMLVFELNKRYISMLNNFKYYINNTHKIIGSKGINRQVLANIRATASKTHTFFKSYRKEVCYLLSVKYLKSCVDADCKHSDNLISKCTELCLDNKTNDLSIMIAHASRICKKTMSKCREFNNCDLIDTRA